MKFICPFIIALIFTTIASAQEVIDLKDVSKHIGDSVLVCGKIFSGRFLPRSEGSPTLLNMGGLYPDQLLTLVIWGKDRQPFNGIPEKLYKDQDVCVTGKIEMFKDKPQIVLYMEITGRYRQIAVAALAA